MAAGLQRLDEPQLLLRRDAGKDGRALGGVGKFLIAESIQIATGERDDFLARVQADLLTDGLGSEYMVAGDHLYPDACGPALFHSGDDLGAGRVKFALQTKEGEFGGYVLVFKIALRGWHFPPGKGEDAQSPSGHRLGVPEYRQFIQR